MLLSKELPHICLVSLSGLRWDEDCLPHQFSRLSWLRINCHVQSLCNDAVETWSWYPAIELLWSHCTLWNWIPCRVMAWVQAYCRHKKKHVHVVGFFWTTYVRNYNNICMFFPDCVTESSFQMRFYVVNVRVLHPQIPKSISADLMHGVNEQA